jgi:hypothetical protein
VPTARPLLSVCLIVKNEEAHLGSCLTSLGGCCDQVVVVDTGSSDSSASIADAAGAEVYSFSWIDDFSAARNFSLDKARGEWVMTLDADEELCEPADRWRTAIDHSSADAIRVQRHNLLPVGDLAEFEPEPMVRLFRNRPGIRYEGAIHEQILPALERVAAVVEDRPDLVLRHHGYLQSDAQGTDSRAARNRRILETVLAREPRDPYLHYQMGATRKAMGDPRGAYESLLHAKHLGAERLGSTVAERLHMKLAQLALWDDDNPAAARYARECLAINDENIIAMQVLGMALIALGDFAAAGGWLDRVGRSDRLRPAIRADVAALVELCRRHT